MKVYFTKIFKKHYAKRILVNKNLDKRFQDRYYQFRENPLTPILKDHALIGKMKGLRAFSITGDIRITYYVLDGTAYFVDIGTHNQVYR